jgi:hypothetical protein
MDAAAGLLGRILQEQKLLSKIEENQSERPNSD